MLPREHYLKQPFQDLNHFPNGFEKGGLSDIQARLIKKNGSLIQALCQDEVSDATSDDLHILKVISNQSAPRNPVEQAWIKYLSIIKTSAVTTKGKSKAKAPAKVAEEPAPIKPSKKAIKAPEIIAECAPANEPEPKKAELKKAEPKKAEAKKSSTKEPAQSAEKSTTSKSKEPKKAASKAAEPEKKTKKK